VPAIGTVGLRAPTPTYVGLVEKLIRDRGLGGASAQQVYRVLSLALRDAVRYEAITRSVATLVGAPKKKPAQLVALTADDGARILETVQHARLGWFDDGTEARRFLGTFENADWAAAETLQVARDAGVL
jgi:hypothetical protein